MKMKGGKSSCKNGETCQAKMSPDNNVTLYGGGGGG